MDGWMVVVVMVVEKVVGGVLASDSVFHNPTLTGSDSELHHGR